MRIVVQANHKYRSDIDGLRALAVLPVVFFHAGFTTFSGGFVGVDVFFVISGYLITSIIAREVSESTFSLANFYERRARRLFPALFVVLFASTLAAVLLLMPWELEDFGESVATTALFSSNFLFFSEAGYFAGPAELKPLLHTWSLAIEEQYYLLFPGFLLLLKRVGLTNYIYPTLGLFVLSLGISIWSVSAAPDAAFYLLPSRTWELMLGSLLALLPVIALPMWLRSIGGIAGLVMIGLAVFTYNASTAFPGLSALLPCVGTALIIFCGPGPSGAQGVPLATRFLSWQPFVWCGLISYSLYLWHWPVLVFAQHYLLRHLQTSEAWLLVAVSILLAYLSWRFVEKPFRGSASIFDRKRIFKMSIASMVMLVAIGLTFDSTEGLPGRLPDPVARVAEIAQDKPAERKRCEGIDPQDFSYTRLCRVNDLEVTPYFIVWGDSHAMSVMPEIGSVAKSMGVNGLNASSNGCVPLLGVTRNMARLFETCLGYSAALLDLLTNHPEITKVILIARWARHAEGTVFGEESGDNGFMATQNFAATNANENLGIYRTAFENTLQTLQNLGKSVVVVGPIPEAGKSIPDVLAKTIWRGQHTDLRINRATFETRQANVHRVFNEVLPEFPITYLPTAPHLCDANLCRVVNDQGLPLYFDDNHLSSHGAKQLRALFEKALQRAAR